MKNITEKSLLPANESNTLKSISLKYGKQLGEIPLEKLSILPTGEKPAVKEMLPVLAAMFDVDISGLKEQSARKIIHNGLLSHRHKGTKWAVESNLKAVWNNAKVVEWFEYGGTPYTFNIEVDVRDGEITPQVIEDIKSSVENSKNVRSIIDKLMVSYLSGANTNISTKSSAEVSACAKQANTYHFLSSASAMPLYGTTGSVECDTRQINSYSNMAGASATIGCGTSGSVSSSAKQLSG